MILVAGGAGFIGSHMCQKLRELGLEHAALDNLEKGHRSALGDTPLVQCDLRDKDATLRALQDLKPEAVIHFAAYIEVGESVRNPAIFWENNIAGSLNLLMAMKEVDCKKIVFSSTAAVYGEPQQIPIPENHPKAPTSPYGFSKLAVEEMLRSHELAYGLRWTALRYFNACGCDPTGVLGEDHDPESHLIPLVLRAIIGKTGPLKVFGTDYPTPDGTCVRDYIHVCDLAEAHVLALGRTNGSGPYNVGLGRGYSVLEVIQAAEKVTGQKVPYSVADRRPGDPAQLIADSSALKADLGWRPKHLDLADNIADVWRWMQNHPNGYGD